MLVTVVVVMAAVVLLGLSGCLWLPVPAWVEWLPVVACAGSDMDRDADADTNTSADSRYKHICRYRVRYGQLCREKLP